MLTHNQIIRRMCELGARPPIVQSFFRDVSLKQVRIIYTEVTGKSPQKGQLPVVIQIYFETRFAVQASLVAKVYIEATKSGSDEARALIYAYEILQIMFKGLVILSFSQVWHITRYIERDHFALQNCHSGHLYLINRKGIHTACPVCKEFKRSKAAIKRNQKSTFSHTKIQEKNVKMIA